MGYVKQLFSPGQVLTAEHMNHIEDGLENHDWQINEFIDFMNEINKTGGGVGIKSIEQTETAYGSGGINIITVTLTDGTVRDFEIRNGQSGQKGKDGVDGLTPEIEVVENYTSNTGKSGVLIKVTQPWWGIDETGADVVLTNIYEVPIFHGSDGQNAKIAIVNVESLDAGSTPSATVSNTPAGAIITLKIPKGDPGKDGSNGKDGSDGFSPTVGVSKSGKATTITITDKNGAKSATINDGADGAPGSNGKDATHSWNGTILTITSASGTSSANLKGEKGDKGDSIKGDDGYSPVRGKDYWTPTDIAEIKSYVDEAILGGAW